MVDLNSKLQVGQDLIFQDLFPDNSETLKTAWDSMIRKIDKPKELRIVVIRDGVSIGFLLERLVEAYPNYPYGKFFEKVYKAPLTYTSIQKPRKSHQDWNWFFEKFLWKPSSTELARKMVLMVQSQVVGVDSLELFRNKRDLMIQQFINGLLEYENAWSRKQG